MESEEIERQGTERVLREVDGILVPGGFGVRGIEGKVETIRYAREHQIPFSRPLSGYAMRGDRIRTTMSPD